MLINQEIIMKAFMIFTTILIVSLHPKSHQAQISMSRIRSSGLSDAPMIFADSRLELVYPIIQSFKRLVTSDPLNVTATWRGPDVCRYRGFFCGAPPDNASATAVASVDFNGFGLSSPSIAGFLDRLPDVAVFHANSNNFSGPFPAGVARLPYLYELDVSNNEFSGPFPFSAVGALAYLDLRFNAFTGSVPPEVFIRGIDFLFLNDNGFVTQLPESIGPDVGLSYLTLANNKFYGPIPRGISRALSGLSEILLLNNSLSGCLPDELGLLKDAVVFDASSNNLTGPLPVSLGCLQRLEVLNFAGNLLYGDIPEALCRLGKLTNLSLSDNYFTRAGPECAWLIERGVLDVRKNCIPGRRLQRPMGECAAYFARRHYCSYANVNGYANVPCWVANVDIPSFTPGLAPESS